MEGSVEGRVRKGKKMVKESEKGEEMMREGCRDERGNGGEGREGGGSKREGTGECMEGGKRW